MIYLKSLLISLNIILFSLTINAQNSKSFVRFSEVPDKRINSADVESTNFFVEYKSNKKATIQIELVKDGKSYAFVQETIGKSKSVNIKKLNMLPKTGTKIIPSGGYSIKLSMYEGEKNKFDHLISETTLENINLTRLLYTKL